MKTVNLVGSQVILLTLTLSFQNCGQLRAKPVAGFETSGEVESDVTGLNGVSARIVNTRGECQIEITNMTKFYKGLTYESGLFAILESLPQGEQDLVLLESAKVLGRGGVSGSLLSSRPGGFLALSRQVEVLVDQGTPGEETIRLRVPEECITRVKNLGVVVDNKNEHQLHLTWDPIANATGGLVQKTLGDLRFLDYGVKIYYRRSSSEEFRPTRGIDGKLLRVTSNNWWSLSENLPEGDYAYEVSIVEIRSAQGFESRIHRVYDQGASRKCFSLREDPVTKKKVVGLCR